MTSRSEARPTSSGTVPASRRASASWATAASTARPPRRAVATCASAAWITLHAARSSAWRNVIVWSKSELTTLRRPEESLSSKSTPPSFIANGFG
ncbi:MAG TPA: hypothetical protein VNU03_11665 [Methylomirabilota bacterium]|nr:hypothetical protein [Methylomirabilota bacterium]